MACTTRGSSKGSVSITTWSPARMPNTRWKLSSACTYSVTLAAPYCTGAGRPRVVGEARISAFVFGTLTMGVSSGSSCAKMSAGQRVWQAAAWRLCLSSSSDRRLPPTGAIMPSPAAARRGGSPEKQLGEESDGSGPDDAAWQPGAAGRAGVGPSGRRPGAGQWPGRRGGQAGRGDLVRELARRPGRQDSGRLPQALSRREGAPHPRHGRQRHVPRASSRRCRATRRLPISAPTARRCSGRWCSATCWRRWTGRRWAPTQSWRPRRTAC